MKKCNLAIIGTGARGNAVLACSEKLRSSSKISYVCDKDISKAKVFAEKYAHDAKITDSLDLILQDSEVEWLGIFTPNYMHAEQACAAMRAGKNVFFGKTSRYDSCRLCNQAS